MMHGKLQNNKVLKRLFFKLLPVQIVLFGMGSINSIIDGTIAGHYIDERTVGAIGLFYAVITIIGAISSIILSGGSVISGNHIGCGDIQKAGGIFSLCIVLSLMLGVITTLICVCFPGPIATFCGADDSLKESVAQYARGYCLGFIPMFLSEQLSYFLQVENQSRRSYVSVVVTIFCNIALNLFFVKVLDLGIIGLAYATSACNWIFFLILVSYYFSDKAQLKFSLGSIPWEKTIDLIKIGSPSALEQLYLALNSLTMNRIILKYGGAQALSARASLEMLGGFFIAAQVGCGAVVKTLSSVYIGEEDRDSIKYLMKLVLTKIMALTFAIMILMMLFSQTMALIFFPDKTSDAYVLTRQLYVIYALALPLILVIQIQSNYLQATKNNIAAHVSSVVDGYFATIIPAVVLAPVIGILGVWWADPIGGVITALVYPIYAIIYWKRIPRNTDEWLLLRDDFGVKEDDRLCIDITGMEDVIGSSSRIQSFVEERGYSHRTAFFSALALEEMAGNIVSYGFGADRKKHNMDVRVVSTKNGVLLRIKDDCRAFNPVEMNQIFNPDDPSKNIGIRMISKIADEFSYQNTFGLNVLTIVIK